MNQAKQESDVWAYDNLEIDDEGFVEGSAYTHTFCDGYDVQIAITSYEYERRGETKMNHVPNVVVSDSEGSIVTEPHAWDAQYPEKAIKFAKQTAESVVEDPEPFIN